MDVKAFLEKLFGCRVDLVLGDAIKHGLRPVILETVVDAPAPGRKTWGTR